MNGTMFARSSMVLGSIALVALGVGCSRGAQPRAPQPSPTFESRVSEPTGEARAEEATGAMTPPGSPSRGAQGAEGSEGGMPGSEGMPGAQDGSQGTAGSQGSSGSSAPLPYPTTPMGSEPTQVAPKEGPPTVSAPMNERGLCTAMSQDASLRVEDVQGGVAIVMTPRGAADMDALRKSARQVEHAVGPAAGRHVDIPVEQRCELMEIGRQATSTTVVEGPGEVRILMTATDATTTRSLRQRARAYVKAASP